MAYIGIQSQVRRNNLHSAGILFSFPILVVFLVWLFFFIVMGISSSQQGIDVFHSSNFEATNLFTLHVMPWILGVCSIWFLIAYFINAFIIKKSTHATSLSRKENKRVYNLVENLCIAEGMPIPKIQVIEDESLNAFASGINERTYTITLTRGIMNVLTDNELEGVIAHELSHIRNRDVRLLIISIVFVGIFSFMAQFLIRMLMSSGRGKNKNKIAPMILIALLVVAVGYLLSQLMRFGISRKREYMADASASQITKNPLALASALKRISKNPNVESVYNSSVSQLFIASAFRKKSSFSLWATHPPIEKRIEVLEQF